MNGWSAKHDATNCAYHVSATMEVIGIIRRGTSVGSQCRAGRTSVRKLPLTLISIAMQRLSIDKSLHHNQKVKGGHSGVRNYIELSLT